MAQEIKGTLCRILAVKCPKCYIFCLVDNLQHPKCFQLFVNREKIGIFNQGNGACEQGGGVASQ